MTVAVTMAVIFMTMLVITIMPTIVLIMMMIVMILRMRGVAGHAFKNYREVVLVFDPPSTP